MDAIERKKTKPVKVGNLHIGYPYPVIVQSMTNTPTEDVEKTIAQIHELQKAGCELVRVAVPTMRAARSLSEIIASIDIPLVADIHFNYKLALEAVSQGVHKLRLNPGNIESKEHVRAVAEAANDRSIPIRIGVNAGSLPRDIMDKYGGPVPEAMVEALLRHVRLLEGMEFFNIVVSLKSSDVITTVRANRLLAEQCLYPIHLGITEAGPPQTGIVKSAVGIGILLHEGIGDTIRVSLTGNPAAELPAAWEILKSLGIRQRGIELISCPTCGRCRIDMECVISRLLKRMPAECRNIKVAVMGCVVNGPGEAKEADVGIAGGKNCAFLFKKGKVLGKIDENQIVDALIREIEKMNAG